MRYAPLGLVFVLWLTGGPCAAQDYYRIVQPDGSVTYTDVPPDASARVERVPVRNRDYETLNSQGTQRLREIVAAAERLVAERVADAEVAAERERRLAVAERELRASQAALEQARGAKKSATPERIRMLEGQVGLARERLRAVRAGAE